MRLTRRGRLLLDLVLFSAFWAAMFGCLWVCFLIGQR